MDVVAVEPVGPVVSIQRPVLFSLRRYVYIDLGWWVPVDTWDRLCTWFTDFRFAQRRDLLGDLSADGDSIDPGLLIALNQTAGFPVRKAALEGFLAHLAQRLLLNRQFSPDLRASQDVVKAVTALISVLRSQVQRHEGGLWLSVAETSERISDSRVRVHDRAGRCVHLGSAPGTPSISGYGLHKGRSVSLGWTAVARDYWAVEQGLLVADRSLGTTPNEALRRVLFQRYTARDEPFDLSPQAAEEFLRIVQTLRANVDTMLEGPCFKRRVRLVRKLAGVAAKLATRCRHERVVFAVHDSFAVGGNSTA